MTSTMGQRTSSPSGAKGIIAVPPMPVAMVSKTSFGKGAPFADETSRKGSR